MAKPRQASSAATLSLRPRPEFNSCLKYQGSIEHAMAAHSRAVRPDSAARPPRSPNFRIRPSGAKGDRRVTKPFSRPYKRKMIERFMRSSTESARRVARETVTLQDHALRVVAKHDVGGANGSVSPVLQSSARLGDRFLLGLEIYAKFKINGPIQARWNMHSGTVRSSTMATRAPEVAQNQKSRKEAFCFT